ncbi:hypothetical protein GCM10011309_25990 [Litorimonas cladophorae]|uniref:DUF262 domain-containing protein n=1 Tax=Litorimonas cladophorae TaxID=1220491 RepID=A0A918NKD4_9PROT|nr:hypothetical protein [Litorimonas cladophorae]GGX74624.1 hypothetical protein GCM10011309_25990 [Litorimonas cladophorae]
MAIQVLATSYDKVIKSYVATGTCTYQYALDNIFPLINKFPAQRKLQNQKFYKRLRSDIVAGCIMPAITLAIVGETTEQLLNKGNFETRLVDEISNSVVLDGMQRLNTLHAASEDEGFDADRLLYVNFILAPDQDRLLYRMITLNNGQKPMTARHQIEILTHSIFDFDAFENFEVQTEKESELKRKNRAFKLADVSKSYTAFLTRNVNNENNKIIDQKMDDILVSRIIAEGVEDDSVNFENVLNLIDRFCVSDAALSWFKVNNNLIGFTAAIKNSFDILSDMSVKEFEVAIQNFDNAFKIIKVSAVNLGKMRRSLAHEFINHIDRFKDFNLEDLESHFIDFTA